nr:MAG TPA: hypothetical protein [Caudoviricetes sp.]
MDKPYMEVIKNLALVMSKLDKSDFEIMISAIF